MPIERKILLTILSIIMICFACYFFYNSYVLNYFEAEKRIDQYSRLINNNKKPEVEITQQHIDDLKVKIELYRSKFFTNTDSSDLLAYIKMLLLNSGISISQFKGSDSSVQFSISGNKQYLSNFLFALYNEPKIYNVPLLNIRMISNTEFQGTIEVSRPILETEVIDYKSSYIHRNQSELSINTGKTLEFLGITLENKQTVILVEPKVETPITNIIYRSTDKFTFVGSQKLDNKTITLFKESSNNRIYRFKIDETISGWTFIGTKNNKFIFKSNNQFYEVTK